MKYGYVKVLYAGLCFCSLLFSGAYGNKDINSVPNVVTADIELGIEQYIEDQTRKGNGYFNFTSDGKEFRFKLVRIHTEYLSNLGPRSHFACVDLVDTAGDVYDVDFFLSGDPGAMSVTQTTLHKLNGVPFYAWAQDESGVWKRVPMEGAPRELLGVKTGEDEFVFDYRVTLPVIEKSARMWLPLAMSDDFQEVKMKIVKKRGKKRILEDKRHGNKVLFFELGRRDSKKKVHIRYSVKRKAKAAYRPKSVELKKHLREDRLVPIIDNFKKIAEKVVEDKEEPIMRARALYDHVIEQMKYAKAGKGWGQGNAVHACDARTGNCTDYHAYFIALARAVNIPARFAIGAAIPSNRNNGGVDGYHCWVEFFADGKWWPIDISEADKYSSLATYYFGHHPANRFEFSRGRDLVVEPGPASGPINFLAHPVLEIDQELVKADVFYSFKRKGSSRRNN